MLGGGLVEDILSMEGIDLIIEEMNQSIQLSENSFPFLKMMPLIFINHCNVILEFHKFEVDLPTDLDHFQHVLILLHLFLILLQLLNLG